MSSGGFLTIDCTEHPTITPLDVRTVTRNTVNNSHSQVDDSTTAKQVVILKLSPKQSDKINVHIKAECNGSELVLTDEHGNNSKIAEWRLNCEIGNQETEVKFHFEQENGVSSTVIEKILIDVWHSNSEEVDEDINDDELKEELRDSGSVSYWKQLEPEIELV